MRRAVSKTRHEAASRKVTRYYLSALQLFATPAGELTVPAGEITAPLMHRALRQLTECEAFAADADEGMLAEGVHYWPSSEGAGFYFASRQCLGIAKRALTLAGYAMTTIGGVI